MMIIGILLLWVGVNVLIVWHIRAFFRGVENKWKHTNPFESPLEESFQQASENTMNDPQEHRQSHLRDVMPQRARLGY
jgi:hypothetical protein